jgi:hypothetical protein
VSLSAKCDLVVSETAVVEAYHIIELPAVDSWALICKALNVRLASRAQRPLLDQAAVVVCVVGISVDIRGATKGTLGRATATSSSTARAAATADQVASVPPIRTAFVVDLLEDGEARSLASIVHGSTD